MSAVVLVEGPSDAVVLRDLARRLGLDGPDLSVVSMGGVTNFAQHLRAYAGRPEVVVTGLCDRAGHDVGGRADLERLGFVVCDGDLEDELIRALGTDTVVDVVAREGELGLLHTFQQQPAQRDRSLHEQLHRFCSTKSGRKVRLAGALAAELALDAVPAPLLGVLTFAHAATA